MSSRSGWVKAHRSFLDWEWFRKGHCFKVMMALVFKANYKDRTHRGTPIPRGSLIIGRELFASELGISISQLRTSLSHLESTGEVTIKSSRKGTLIQVVKYEDYQSLTSESTSKPTSNLTSELTSKLTTLERSKKEEDKNTTPTITPPARGGELFDEVDTPPKKQAKKKAFVPPTLEEFVAHAIEKLPTHNAEWTLDRVRSCASLQFDTYVDQDWHDGNGKKISNWKTKSINAMIHKKPWSFGAAKTAKHKF